jgi:hypothetical protein
MKCNTFVQYSCYVILTVWCLLYYTTHILILPPTHPLLRDYPYKRPHMGGAVGGLLGVTSRCSLFDLDNLRCTFKSYKSINAPI